MLRKFQPDEYISLLSSLGVCGKSPCLVGVIKWDSTPNTAKALSLSLSPSSGCWASIPISTIEGLVHLGLINHEGQNLPVVKLLIKPGTEATALETLKSLVEKSNPFHKRIILSTMDRLAQLGRHNSCSYNAIQNQGNIESINHSAEGLGGEGLFSSFEWSAHPSAGQRPFDGGISYDRGDLSHLAKWDPEKLTLRGWGAGGNNIAQTTGSSVSGVMPVYGHIAFAYAKVTLQGGADVTYNKPLGSFMNIDLRLSCYLRILQVADSGTSVELVRLPKDLVHYSKNWGRFEVISKTWNDSSPGTCELSGGGNVKSIPNSHLVIEFGIESSASYNGENISVDGFDVSLDSIPDLVSAYCQH